jgi:hypothetical protein
MPAEELFAAAFALVVLSGVAIVVLGLRQRTQQLEMQHRERMAMIERGLVPFDERRTFGETADGGVARRRGPSSRATPMGILVVAVGLGLMSIVSIAGGAPEVGVGLGGAIAIVGAAFIAIGLMARPQSDDRSPAPSREPHDPSV